MKKLFALLLISSSVAGGALFAVVDCTSATCSVNLLDHAHHLGRSSIKSTNVPCETAFPQQGSNVLQVKCNQTKRKFKKKHFPTVSGIFKEVNVTPGQSYCITAIGKIIDPSSSVQIFLHQKGTQTVSSPESLTDDFQIVTLNFIAVSPKVYVALGAEHKNKATFQVQKFTLETCDNCFFQPLNILLTNDDGLTDIGIQTLKTVFTNAGHNVFVVAPSGNVDASSSAINTPASVPPQFVLTAQVSSNEWAVSIINNPATPVIVAPAFPVTAVAQAPLVLPAGTVIDLIISGINSEGLNAGPIANVSGTVGVARVVVTDADQQSPPTPAIAVSSQDNKTPAFVQQVATFVLDLVTQLQCSTFYKQTGTLLPSLTALNVNYPNLPLNQIQGVKVTRQGIVAYDDSGNPTGVKALVLGTAPGIVISALVPATLAPVQDIPDSDSLAVKEGFISVEPISGDLSAAACATRQIIDIIPKLSDPSFGTYLPQDTTIQFCPVD